MSANERRWVCKGYGFQEPRGAMETKVSEELQVCEKRQGLRFSGRSCQWKSSVTRCQLSSTDCLSYDWAPRVPIFLCFDTKFALLASLHSKISAFLPCVLPLPRRTWSYLSWQLSWTWEGKLPGVKIHDLVAPPSRHSSLYHGELICPKLWCQHSGLQKWTNTSDLPYAWSNVSSWALQMMYIKSAPCFLRGISYWRSAA